MVVTEQAGLDRLYVKDQVEMSDSVNAMVERAVRAQKAFQDWPEERIDQLLQALAERVNIHAEDLAIAAVQETRPGNVADKTAKNRFASLDVYRSLVGQIGHGRRQRWLKESRESNE